MSITEALVTKYLEQQAGRLAEPRSPGLWESLLTVIAQQADRVARLLQGDVSSSELLAQKKAAISYSQWLHASEQLDEKDNFNAWKLQKETSLYDYELIEANLKDLREARASGDVHKTTYLIRTTWTRNIGNIGNVNLYRRSHTGTKLLIEEYLEECELALEQVTKEGSGIDDRYVLGMLIQTRKNVGRTALVLSGGGCFGLFHIGVLAALLEGEILPRIISGSSAGAIVASILCVHNHDEIVDLLKNIVDKNFQIFDDNTKKEGFLRCLSRFLKYGTWFDSVNLKATMIDFLGDLTFREAYYRTGKILNVTVSPTSVHEHPGLLNYLTAPSVLIWSAVCASCALPGVFASSTIYEKNPKTGATQEWHHASIKFVDGSVDNDLPISRLSEMFNVDHIIACQVNPHVVPFLKLSVTCVGGEIETEYSARFKTKLGHIYELATLEVSHYLKMAAEIGISRNFFTKIRSVLSQKYSGDITILPDISEVLRLNKLLVNPTPEYLVHATMKGARATWPKISIIKNHCGLELALDQAINVLKARNFQNFDSHLTLVNSTMNIPPNVIGQNDKRRNHIRQRSETIAIGKLKPLRPSKSTVHVENLRTPPRRYTTAVNRYHRSYSGSNDAAYLGTSHSEAVSPISTREADQYFRVGLSSSSSPIKQRMRPKVNSTSSSSERLFISPRKGNARYSNVDDLDGLFSTDATTSALDEADFVKLDGLNGHGVENDGDGPLK